jgi:hypothetical protein
MAKRGVIGQCSPTSDVNLKENIVPIAWEG